METAVRLRAEITASALEQVVGKRPLVTERPNGSAYLIFNKADIPAVQKSLESIFLRPATQKPTVSVSFMPIVAPLVFKQAFPVILGLVLGGALIGYGISRI